MSIRIRCLSIGLSGAAVGFLAVSATAQTPSNPAGTSATSSNSPGAIQPGMSGQAQSFANSGSATSSGSAAAGMPYAGPANPYTNPNAGNSITTSPYPADLSSNYPPNPYSGYYETPLGGYLRGTADIITSQGKWYKDVQSAFLLQEKYKQERIATRRKKFEEYLYERERTPTVEEDRQRLLQQQIARSLNDPPQSEIWSGQALNNIVADVRKLDNKSGARPNIPIDEDVLRHVNLSPGGGNPGLLKNEGRLHWPMSLQGEEFKSQRELLNSLAPEAVRQAINGRVDPGILKDMTDAVAKIRQNITANIRDLTPNQFVEANRFLSQFDDALKILARPDAGDFFSPKFSAKGMTVTELLKYMADKGLSFAPAVTGDESAYAALHRALVSYDNEAKSPQNAGR